MLLNHRRRFALLTALIILLPIFARAKVIDYPHWPGVAVVKIMPGYLPQFEGYSGERTGITSIDFFLDEIGATKVELKFIDALPPTSGGVDITRFYNIYFPEMLTVPEICRDFLQVEGIELAEPWQIDYLILDHNDPRRGDQYGLDLCEANAAHDISTGNRNAPIAIVDTGVSMTHPDLAANIWVNPAEDLNGDGRISQNERDDRVDDDNNGRVNDFYGWDFVGNDNDPTDVDGHGTHCAGIASAVTNNNTGISSVGYSCAIMAIRAGTGQVIQYGYEGITYAVRTGAKVISCSWGGYGGNDWTFQVVQAARQNDVLVICAAGNDGNDQEHFPSAYDAVVAVAATDRNDRKAGFSNYGDWIDISAPGVGILSTVPGNGYQAWDGTSMACPFAAGVAVLIRATYPELNVQEARDLLLQGATNIDNLNRGYENLLGSGRINARLSLELGNRPRLAIDELQILSDDNNNGAFDPGENIEIAVSVSNSENARAAGDIVVNLSSGDPDFTFENNDLAFPDLEPGDALANVGEPFYIHVSDEAMPHTSWITITVTATPGNFVLEKTFEIIIGHPPILVVDDDDGLDIEQYYLESVENGGRGWVRWNVAENYSPDATTLGSFDMVIWETGDADPPLDDLDRYQIEAALIDGANIMLVGNHIGDDPDNRDLLRSYFGAQHEEDSVGAYTIEGLTENRPLGVGVQMMLTGDGGAGNGRISPSSMSPVYNADSLAVYYIGTRPQGLAGIYRDIDYLHSKTVYMGFSFEGVTNVRTTRAVVIDRLYNWFTGNGNSLNPEKSNTPVLLSLSEAYPNPFNGLVNLRWTVPVGMDYKLGIYDPAGREVTILALGVGRSVSDIASWNASSVPSGIYYARLDAAGAHPLEQRLVLVK